ncbi:MAG: hypothetical protein JRN06_09195 [Nitrososphaerota archaeon]|nr:hypothetical protein [Nitrososphaerota archaeon]MDG7024760.1 hypothetical protein [Nitrososphaerota archaeon]
MVAVAAGELRRGISVAAVAAVVCVVAVAGGVAYLYYPSLSPGGETTTAATTSRYQGNPTTCTKTLSRSTAPLPSKMSAGQGGWDPFAVANVTLNYYMDSAYIRMAWNYTYDIVQTGSNPVLVSNYIQTLGPLSVYGNWTTGYTLNFTRTMSFNVTVQFTQPSTYQVVGFRSTNSTIPANEFQRLQFNVTQQRATSITLADGSVRACLNQPPYHSAFYYVDSAYVFPSGNKTFGGDYFVSIYQTDGPGVLNAFVNMQKGAVAATYSGSWGSTECYSNGGCFTSPWT